MRYVLRNDDTASRYISDISKITPIRVYHSATIPFSRKFNTDIHAIEYFYKCANMVDAICLEKYYICSIIGKVIIEETPFLVYIRKLKIDKILNKNKYEKI